MSQLIVAFIDIALHRRGPEHLPASGFLFGLVLVAYLVTGGAAVLVQQPEALSLVPLEALLLLSFVAIVLRLFDLQRRFLQAATAMLGTGALLNAISVPIGIWSARVDAAAPGDLTADVPIVLLLLLLCWSIDVSSFVLARTLERPYLVGLAIMLGYQFIVIGLSSALVADR